MCCGVKSDVIYKNRVSDHLQSLLSLALYREQDRTPFRIVSISVSVTGTEDDFEV